MKKSFLGLALGVVLLVVTAILTSNNASSPKELDGAENKNTSVGGVEVEKTNSNPKAEASTGTDAEYMIIMEQNMLCTYRLDEKGKTLLKQSEIVAHAMPETDVKRLKEGIVSESLEQIYLYYEAYAS